ncbi:LisH dimerization motif [Kalmanozyma brasiliensis GHG001]|uniref:LisH dimerization motif n=1 Tax=Kalmanozyma brasiliensis (strain GHG001) TaxID=1365824 RepID=UPI0028680E53|nr:LisH dimerization motif [Kalmanozyma brasiliensis GHG001]EST07187.2 LisH dimerization motif [Kalmanozyma brasiliensis GHG001]
MDQQYGQQHSSKGSQPTPQPGPWDGDQMLHIYLRDYLHKRGYSQAAQALSGEAGLEPSRQVPIDAPQSLLFEWWVVFWDIFASRADEAGVDVNGGLAEDARVYVVSRASVMPEARMAASECARAQMVVPNAGPTSVFANGHQMQQHHSIAQQHPAHGRRPSAPHQDTLGTAPFSLASPSSASSSSSFLPLAPPQQRQRRRSSISTLPQLDLDVSRTLGLIRPASLVVIQQCMDMMGFGGKRVDQLDAKQQQALAKRLNRLQTAHTDAQVKLAQLHGIQPPKALLVNSSARTQPRPTAVDGYANGAGQKRKFSPTASHDPNPNRQVGGVGQDSRSIPLHATQAPAQSIRRLSYPSVPSVPSVPSPLTLASVGGMPLTHVSPHPVIQQPSPASSAPTPSEAYAMGAPATLRLSSSGVDSSPHRIPHASGLAAAPPSMSPIAEWPAVERHSNIPPPQQSQQAIALSTAHDSYTRRQMYAQEPRQLQSLPYATPLSDTHLNTRPLENTVGLKPIHPASQAKFFAPNAVAGAPAMPFDEYDFNVLLSQPLLAHDEASALARQLGDVGSF